MIIDRKVPTGLTDPEAVSSYRRGYSNTPEAVRLAAIADFGEAIRTQPEAPSIFTEDATTSAGSS